MTGSGNIPGSSLHRDVEVDVKVNVTPVVKPQEEEQDLARCQHGNYAGQCLLCYRMEHKS